MKSTRNPHLIAARARNILLAGALSLWSIPARAQAPPERLSDKSVKMLIDQVDEGRDKFANNLDNQLGKSTVRGPNGETPVSALLQDYRDNTKKLRDRFDDRYAASADVATVLKQAAAIHRFMQGTSSVMKGRREWDAEAASLTHLAEAYGTTFPMPDGATTSRVNDQETAAVAAAIVTAANRFKDDLDNIMTLPKPEKDAAKKDVEVLIKHAAAVKDRTSDGKPATGDLRQLAQQVATVQTFVGAHEIPTAMANWQIVQASLVKLQQAFLMQ